MDHPKVAISRVSSSWHTALLSRRFSQAFKLMLAFGSRPAQWHGKQVTIKLIELSVGFGVVAATLACSQKVPHVYITFVYVIGLQSVVEAGALY